MIRKLTAVLLTLVLALGCTFALAEDTTAEIAEIQKYGNLVLNLKGTELLAAGFDYGDVVTVTLNGQAYDMPVGTNYADVDQGSMICRVVIKEGAEDNVILAINMGDLATTAGIAQKEKIEADPGYVWHMQVEEPVQVSIAMKDKGGYRVEWEVNQLVRSEVREDYPQLSDEQYANFRAVATTGVGEGKLYRSSSPVNPEINRNTYADAAAKAAGIATVMNLADAEEVMKGYEGYADTYYSTAAVIALNLGVDFSADEFKAGLANGLRFMANGEAPYLVHCNEGKDRAGFASAVLECLMGATEEEVVADYMVTFYNYYGVQPGTEQYTVIAAKNIRKSLAAAFGVEDIAGVDLAAEAADYLAEIGLNADEIALLKTKLGK